MVYSQLQWVWPIHPKKGHTKQTTFQHIQDVLTNSGPDVFVQEKGSKKPIKVDRWTNWDSYHDIEKANVERHHASRRLGIVRDHDRGFTRYDPETRKYVRWMPSHNFEGYPFAYPTLLASDAKKLGSLTQPKDWIETGPKRFRPEHDAFWRAAHRLGEDRRYGNVMYPWLVARRPRLTMSEEWQDHYLHEHGGMLYEIGS